MTGFAEATAIEPAADGFTGTVDPRWTIGGKPNGGYLLAMMARAALAISSHEHVMTASAQYLHSPDPGPVRLEAEILRAGRSASQLRVRMSQGDAPCVEAQFTTTRFGATEPYWTAGVPDLPADDPARAIRVPAVNPAGITVAIMDQVELRIERETLGFGRGQPSGRGELRGYLSLLDGLPFDPVSLLYALDSFPPATFDIELTGWVPTLQLTAYVRALPAAGPLRVLQRAHLIDAQRVDEACWVWDSRGRVVAHGVQLAGIRLG